MSPASCLWKSWGLPGLPDSQGSRLQQIIRTTGLQILCPMHIAKLSYRYCNRHQREKADCMMSRLQPHHKLFHLEQHWVHGSFQELALKENGINMTAYNNYIFVGIKITVVCSAHLCKRASTTVRRDAIDPRQQLPLCEDSALSARSYRSSSTTTQKWSDVLTSGDL